MTRLVLVALVVAAAAVALVLWWRGREAGSSAAARPPMTTVVAPPVVPPPVAPSRNPALPPGAIAPSPPIVVPPPAPAPPTAPGTAVAFDDERRDAAWADDHERELGHRLRAIADELEERGVAARLGAPACRRTLCRVTIAAADAGALGKVYGALETEEGLVGWADALLLEGVVTADDGRVETRVVAQFVRDAP